MSIKLDKIVLNTVLGPFTFQNHFNSNSDAYNAMCLFESNNWGVLGETTYDAYFEYLDGVIQPTHFDGMNASANLAETLEDVKLK